MSSVINTDLYVKTVYDAAYAAVKQIQKTHRGLKVMITGPSWLIPTLYWLVAFQKEAEDMKNDDLAGSVFNLRNHTFNEIYQKPGVTDVSLIILNYKGHDGDVVSHFMHKLFGDTAKEVGPVPFNASGPRDGIPYPGHWHGVRKHDGHAIRFTVALRRDGISYTPASALTIPEGLNSRDATTILVANPAKIIKETIDVNFERSVDPDQQHYEGTVPSPVCRKVTSAFNKVAQPLVLLADVAWHFNQAKGKYPLALDVETVKKELVGCLAAGCQFALDLVFRGKLLPEALDVWEFVEKYDVGRRPFKEAFKDAFRNVAPEICGPDFPHYPTSTPAHGGGSSPSQAHQVTRRNSEDLYKGEALLRKKDL